MERGDVLRLALNSETLDDVIGCALRASAQQLDVQKGGDSVNDTEQIREKIVVALQRRDDSATVIVWPPHENVATWFARTVVDGVFVESERDTELDTLRALAVACGLRDDGSDPSADVERVTAEVEMLRGVGCSEDGDGPCGVCLKCARRERDDARAALADATLVIRAFRGFMSSMPFSVKDVITGEGRSALDRWDGEEHFDAVEAAMRSAGTGEA